MHYEEEIVLEKATLSIVVYKHDTGIEGKYWFQMMSIQSCTYFPPFHFRILMNKLSQHAGSQGLQFLDHLPPETWQLCIFKTKLDKNGISEYYLESNTDVSKWSDEFMRLH